MKNPVIVKSKTINNEAVPVVFHIVEKRFGEVTDVREISRTYIFRDFKAEMPLKQAKILIKQNPNEFAVLKSLEKNPSKVIKAFVKASKGKGLLCKICGAGPFKNRAGLAGHMLHKHPKKEERKEK